MTNAKSLDFWRSRLVDLPSFALPTDRPLPVERSAAVANHRFEISAAQVAVLQATFKGSNDRLPELQLDDILSAAFSILLARHAGQNSLVVGRRIAGGLHEAPVIVPLRGQWQAKSTFHDIVRLMAAERIAGAPYAMPFGPLVSGLETTGDGLRPPICQVTFALADHDPRLPAPEVGGTLTPFDIDLALWPSPSGGLAARFAYALDLFTAPTLERLTHRFLRLVDAICQTPEAPVSQLEMLPPAELQALLFDWNSSARNAHAGNASVASPDLGDLSPVAEGLDARLRQQAAVHADLPAVIDGEQIVTYQQLFQRASMLAQQLKKHSGGAECGCGLMLNRSVDAVVGMLACLEANAFFVPMDPAAPASRKQLMMLECGTGCIITHSRFADALPAGSPPAVFIDQLPLTAPVAPLERAFGNQLAYVIYTSGSTGVPKGVGGVHQAVLNLVDDLQQRAPIQPGDRCAWSASLAFDVTIGEVFGCLGRGGTLVVMPDEARRQALDMFTWLGEQRIVYGEVPAPYLAQFLDWLTDEANADELALATLTVGTEAIPEPRLRAIASRRPSMRVVNFYGPTEATVECTAWALDDSPLRTGKAPIGLPQANTRAFITDWQCRPLPTGITGELLIGGLGLARGYLGRPGLTAASFIPDPFATQPGDRLYRTGDLARWLPADIAITTGETGEAGETGETDTSAVPAMAPAVLEFMGRRDEQLKVRGFRIEPGEVEAALVHHPAIQQAVVTAQDDNAGGQRLVAFVIAQPEVRLEQRPSVSDLRLFLTDSLPDYMTPSALQYLEEMPLTATGKVDRRSLPQIDVLEAAMPAGDSTGPRGPIETALSAIWGELLGTDDRLSIHHHFFELGGHSLLATQVISRIRDRLGVDLPISEIFDRPTIADLASAVAARRQQKDGGLLAPQIEPGAARRVEAIPLSFAQERMWIVHQWSAGSAAYNIPVTARLHGDLDVEALRRSVNALVRRHRLLRTRLVEFGGRPRQVIDPPTGLPLTLVDLAELSASERESEVRQHLQQAMQEPFDLATGPMMSAQLLRLAPKDHILALVFDHAVFDGGSDQVLNHELAAFYGAYSTGKKPQLPDLTVQYADFALWQHRWLAGEVLEAQLDYWRRRLAALGEPAELLADRPRPTKQPHRGGRLDVQLPGELRQGLEKLGHNARSTLFMTLLAGFKAILSRWTGQSDMVVGSPIDGRNHSELENLIGMFVNMLVLRTDLGPEDGQEATFHQLLQRVRRTTLGALAHQDLPFEKLVERLQPDREPDRNPFFQVTFQLLKGEHLDLTLPGLDVEPIETPVSSAKFDLELNVLDQPGGGLRAYFDYSADLFDHTTIARFAEQWLALLRAVVSNPHQRLSQLPALSTAQHHQAIYGYNDTYSDFPRDANLSQLLDRAKVISPTAIAVTHGEQRLSWQQLDEQANQLAHWLQQHQAGPEIAVALCLERSPMLIVAVAAVAKSGGCYVPLDPSYPHDRLTYMLEDSAAAVLLTEDHLAPQFRDLTIHCLLLDRDWQAEVASLPTTTPTADANPANPACYIYTSGSTGKPKGVVISQQAMARLVLGTDYLQLGPEDCLSQIGSFSFDAASFEIWGALLNGARLVFLDRDDALSAPRLKKLAEREGITILFLTTALFNQLLSQDAELCAGFRSVLFGGERADAEAVRTALTAPPEHLLHMYGPTESTTYATWHRVRQLAEGAGSVPIGQAMSNTEVLVLDRHLVPVPPGSPGELCIAGEGLARGYHGRPSLTAGVFVPNPHGHRGGDRLYRTGDLVRRLNDGTIDFIGRIDHQVKVRGYRIELGEIEAALSSHPQVRERVVVVQPDAAGTQCLAGFVVPRDLMDPPSGRDLRTFLRASLPDFMVPSAFAIIGVLPLTPNGKVDKRSLPNFELLASHDEEELIAPRDEFEEVMEGIWCDVMGADRLSVDANFFDLGGHSLLATQLLSRLRDQMGVDLPLRTVFDAPTIANMSELVRNQQEASAIIAEPPIEAGRETIHPLSFSQQRLWFLTGLDPTSPVYNVPLAVRLRGPLNADALAQAIDRVVERHEALRSQFSEVEGVPQQIALAPAPGLLSRIDLTGAATERLEAAQELARAEALRPFDLTAGPAFRAQLLCLADDDHILITNAHHIVFDGWSEQVLLREIAAYYDIVRGEAPLHVPFPLAVQYGDFARHQLNWLTDDALQARLRFWRQYLADLGPLELTTDHPRPAIQSFRGALLVEEIAPELAAGVRALARELGSTHFLVLLAAFKAVLYHHSGQTDVVVGSLSANRQRTEVEPLIGFFVNTLVLRTDLAGNPTFSEVLERVTESFLGAEGHQDLPFEKLVEELQPKRDASRNPFFQISFQVVKSVPPEIGELQAEVMPLHSDTAKFDIELTVVDHGEGLRIELEYAADLFDRSTMERLTAGWCTLLGAALDDPGRRLFELPAMTRDDRHKLLATWNDLPLQQPIDGLMHQLVAERCNQATAQLAIVGKAEQLTYGELERRANRLARHLRACGIGPEIMAAFCLERTPDLIVAALAILKAGGTYVPLDPNYPPERLAFTLEDADARVLITQESLLPLLPQHGARLLRIDRDAALFEALEDGPLTHGEVPPMSPDHLAYVIYTSGSTGRAKGVAISHRSAVAMLSWSREVFSNEEIRGTLFSTSVCFDLSIFEMFVPLSRGGSVILANNALEVAAQEPASLPQVPPITLLNTVPSALRELLRDGHLPTSIQTINLAGEALPQDLVDRAYQEPGVKRVYNLYGPSEDTTYSTYALVPPDVTPPIGRPISGSRSYVLDGHGLPTPIGVPGDLHLAGSGLARGYLGRPATTAERFVPDPFAAAPGQRMYRTGDLVRYLPDATLMYLGRLDHQVKIRGFRIELGEVEARLGQHPAVKERVVVAQSDPEGGQRMVAFLTLADGTVADGTVADGHKAPSAAELRSFLEQSLPRHMVPGLFQVLDSLPTTPNGKVDRKALPDLTTSSLTNEEATAPRTATEQRLAELWSEVLGQPGVGALDDFFALGGHSLLATRLLARVRDSFAVELPLRIIFQASSVATMAKEIDRLRQQESADGSAPDARHTIDLRPLASDETPRLSFAQQRLWFLVQWDASSTVYNMPFGLRLRGFLDEPALERALLEVVRRHQVLRTRFTATGGEPNIHVDSVPERLLERLELPNTGSDAISRAFDLARQRAARPFDLTAGPVFRCDLVPIDDDDDDHLLLLDCHHIVSDGWSLEVLMAELNDLYSAFAAGQPSPLAEMPLQYADFANWQRRWLDDDELARQLDFWRLQLAAAPPLLELPTDRPRPLRQTYDGDTVFLEVSAPITQRLRRLSREHGVTLFMTLLSSYYVLLHRLTGAKDLSVGVPVANRPLTQLEGLIGFFVNSLVLRLDMGGLPTFKQVLQRVERVALDAFEHPDVPFEKLVEELQPERDSGHQPLFQVAFQLAEGAPEPALGDLEVSRTDDLLVAAKYDLDCGVEEQSNGGLVIAADYNIALFDRSSVDCWLQAWGHLLEAMVADPEGRINDVPLLLGDARQQVLDTWGRAPREYPRDASLIELFTAQATERGAETAIIFGDVSLTYQQLATRGNQLAHHLIALGVQPGDLVAMCLDRSADLVIAILAILEAGAAYLPLDPEYPEDRLALMVEDSATPLIIVHDHLAQRLPSQIAQLDISAAAPTLANLPTTAPKLPVEIDGSWPVYAIFTSGSTGRPKGTLVPQRAVTRLVLNTNYVQLAPHHRLSQGANVSFDVATFEIWGAMLNGACLVGLDTRTLLSSKSLGETIERTGIDILSLPTAVMHQVANDPPAALAQIESLHFAGEACDAALVRKLAAVMPKKDQLVNAYGPTECTTYATTYDVSQLPTDATSVPIGGPIANTDILVLDPHGQPTLPGVSGELLLGGPGLAFGYIRRPALTAAAFVPHPYSDQPGTRLYRTGDRVRFLASGDLEFLGRFDHQVKFRGFRVELGEIDAVLAQHAAVSGQLTLVRDDQAGTPRLVSYVTLNTGETDTFDTTNLLDHLVSHLPEFMVPSDVVVIGEFPLTPNRKVDRRALPAPQRQRDEQNVRHPDTPLANLVARIWGDVLGLETLGLDDSFFELGGHSLLATKVFARLADDLGYELPLHLLFDAPRLGAFVASVESELRGSEGGEEVLEMLELLEGMSEEERLALLGEDDEE